MSTLIQDDSLGYAMLIFDELKLLIPQTQITSLEMAAAMEIDESKAATAGYFQFENKSWPTFCFSNNLSLLTPPPLSRRICILMQTENEYFSILCDQALLLKQGVIQLHSLSESMATDNTPVSALAIYNDEIITISSAEHLAELLPLNETITTASAELA